MAYPHALMHASTRWLALFAGWSVIGALQGLTSAALMPKPAQAWQALFTFYLPLAWTWALLTPVIGALTTRIRARYPASLAARVAAHAPLVLGVALLHTAVRRALALASGGALTVGFEVTLLYFADLTVVSYLAAVWAARALHAGRALESREQQATALRQQLLGAQMEYLELQLRPHFLFNALGTITELAHEAPKSAARMLRNLSALLESAVTREGRRLVTLGEELDALQPYLEIQRLRFSDWLVIEEDIAGEARGATVPRFILQPLVENAVHHGLISRSERGRIGIRARVNGDRLTLTVLDNGVGLQAAPTYREGRGLGLANLRARLHTVYGGAAALELHDEADAPGGTGTAAVLELPLSGAAAGSADQDAPVDDDAPVRVAAATANAPLSRWITDHPARAIVAAWALVAVLRTQHSYGYMVMRNRLTADLMTDAIRFDVAVAVVWLALTPFVLMLARRVPLRRKGRAGLAGAAVHVATAVILAWGHGLGSRFLGVAGPASWAFPGELFAWNLIVYGMLVVIVQAHDLEAWIRDRDRDAERLRKELREARFRRVMLELRPAVLLQTLRHLEALVVESPARAERVLADIGEFLRATLKTIHEPVVTLREEGDTVRAYARVLGVASVPDLTLHMSLAVPVLDDPVPNGVLRFALDEVLDARGPDRRGAVVRLDAITGDTGMSIHAIAQSGTAPPSSWSATVTGSPPVIARAAA